MIIKRMMRTGNWYGIKGWLGLMKSIEKSFLFESCVMSQSYILFCINLSITKRLAPFWLFFTCRTPCRSWLAELDIIIHSTRQWIFHNFNIFINFFLLFLRRLSFFCADEMNRNIFPFVLLNFYCYRFLSTLLCCCHSEKLFLLFHNLCRDFKIFNGV